MNQDKKPDPKGPQAARWRQRKFRTLERFAIPGDLLPGSLTMSRTRCGKPTCHCAQVEGHEAWIFTFMSEGKQRVERIPRGWVEEVRQRVEAGRDFQNAVREVLTANAELLILSRKQGSKRRR
ncbi:MAG: DUF6788 family protein [Candidatus Sulfotelmatobacter sp.]|jgi:hypothetical protein